MFNIKNINIINFWKKLKIQPKLLIIILTSSIIPIILIAVLTSVNIYRHLETQEHTFYTALLTQVQNNIDYLYDQNARAMSNIADMSLVQSVVFSPIKPDVKIENENTQKLMGANNNQSLRKFIEERMGGNFCIFELDRPSTSSNTDYTSYIYNTNIAYPNIEKLIEDPLFLKVKGDNKLKSVFGMLKPRVLRGGIKTDKSPVIIYPYYKDIPENDTDTFEKFFIYVMPPDTMRNIYRDIEPMKFGTLYILDKDNNLIAFNHPDDDDNYYNSDTNMYELGDEPTKIEGDPLEFSDYQMLNIDREILNTKYVKRMLNSIDNRDIPKFLTAKEFKQYIIAKLSTNEDKRMFHELYEKDRDGNYVLERKLEKEEIEEGTYILEDIGFFNRYSREKQYITFNKKTFLTIARYSDVSGTKFVYFHPVKQIQKPILQIILIISILSIIVILVLIILSISFSKTFTKPIKVLADATGIIANGDYTHFISIAQKDEIGDLSTNFNQMIRNIKAFQDKLLSAEREKSELELASKIQTCLLPKVQEREFYELTARMIPASEVGGDYYDFIGEADGKIWLGIGDVSGHGLTSGLIMMMAQTGFNTILLNNPTISASDLISQVNKVMYQNIKERMGEDHFMTLSFMVADKDGTVKYSGAHLDVLIYRKKTKTVERIETVGVWLGLLPDITGNMSDMEFTLEQGDTVLLYTDGLIEATNSKNEQYDMGRLIDKFQESGEQSLKDIEQGIVDDVFNFLSEQKDDITFVIMRKK